jgi:hypothetical protein
LTQRPLNADPALNVVYEFGWMFLAHQGKKCVPTLFGRQIADMPRQAIKEVLLGRGVY